MSAADVVYGLLTALFAAAAVRGLRHGVLSPGSGRHSRVDRLLHTGMTLTMAVMPWSRGTKIPGRPQTVLFAAAAPWFPASALARRRGRRRPERRRSAQPSCCSCTHERQHHVTWCPSDDRHVR